MALSISFRACNLFHVSRLVLNLFPQHGYQLASSPYGVRIFLYSTRRCIIDKYFSGLVFILIYSVTYCYEDTRKSHHERNRFDHFRWTIIWDNQRSGTISLCCPTEKSSTIRYSRHNSKHYGIRPGPTAWTPRSPISTDSSSTH